MRATLLLLDAAALAVRCFAATCHANAHVVDMLISMHPLPGEHLM